MVTAKELMNTDFIKLDVKDNVSKFMGVILKKKQHYALLYEKNVYKGYADKKFLIKSRLDPDNTKLQKMLKHIPVLKKEMNETDMSKLFVTADVRTLPVFDGNKVLGVVNSKQLLPYIKMSGLIVEDVAKTAISFNENTPIGKLISSMHYDSIDRAPVVDDKGDFVGVISLIDVISDFLVWPRCSESQKMSKSASHQKGKHTGYGTGEKQDINKQPISNIMTREINCCTNSPKQKINELIDCMIKWDTTSSIILENKKPVGIVTIKDLMNQFK